MRGNRDVGQAGPCQDLVTDRFILFGHWEYHGKNFEADLAALNVTPMMRKWLAICGPMQAGPSAQDDGWAVMEEVFHLV